MQERALKAVPNLCETIDYAEVQGVLFPRVAVSILTVALEPLLNVFSDGVYENQDIVCQS